MARAGINKSVERVEIDGFQFPLGVYPIEPMAPRAGYTVEFEPADGGEAESDWEEWPDRYMFDIVAPANRLRSLCRSLFTLLPSRVYPILDILGDDAHREVDPYIAYDPTPFDRFISLVHRHADWLFEDGLVGFGAMSEDPFLYVYVDEHKIVTVRAEAGLREKIERVLDAYDIPTIGTLAGADAAAHEHRSVLDPSPEHLIEEEILEELLDNWRLQLNIDRYTNIDDAGRELGVTGWRCLVRAGGSEQSPPRYIEALLRAGSLDEAETLAIDAAAGALEIDLDLLDATAAVLLADRVTPESMSKLLAELGVSDSVPDGAPGVLSARALDDQGEASPEPGS